MTLPSDNFTFKILSVRERDLPGLTPQCPGASVGRPFLATHTHETCRTLLTPAKPDKSAAVLNENLKNCIHQFEHC